MLMYKVAVEENVACERKEQERGRGGETLVKKKEDHWNKAAAAAASVFGLPNQDISGEQLLLSPLP